MDDATKGAARPSRRVLARGAAWSVPVVAVGAAAPAMAAGGTATVTFIMGQNGNELVTATISTTTGQVITGDTTASVNITRNGNSNNYNCVVTG